MCNREQRKSSEKRFAQLPRSSIRRMAEAGSHCNLSDDILALLAENANYFLRQTMQSAAQFMRHSHRKVLTTRDVDRALQCSDIPSLYGHNIDDSSDSNGFTKYKVNLMQLVGHADNFDVVPTPTLAYEWILSPSDSSQPPSTHAMKTRSNVSPVDEQSTSQVLAEPYRQYLDFVTEAVSGFDTELQASVLKDLSCNTRLLPILAHLARFIINSVQVYKNDISLLTMLLQIVKALVINPSLYLGCVPHLTMLVDSLLFCILEQLGDSEDAENDHWVIRDTASNLLVRLFSTCVTPVNVVYNDMLRTLEAAFKDAEKPFYAHYGAVTAIIAFGTNAIEKFIYPHMSTYMARMADAANNADAQMVFGALQTAGELMLQTRMNMNPAEFENEVTKPTESNCSQAEGPFEGKSAHDLYKELFGYFGEPFAVRLPISKVGSSCILRKRKKIVKHTSASEVTAAHGHDSWDKSCELYFGSMVGIKGACGHDRGQESEESCGVQHSEVERHEMYDSSKEDDCEEVNGEKRGCNLKAKVVGEDDEHSEECEADEGVESTHRGDCEEEEDVGEGCPDENSDDKGKDEIGRMIFASEGSSDGDCDDEGSDEDKGESAVDKAGFKVMVNHTDKSVKLKIERVKPL